MSMVEFWKSTWKLFEAVHMVIIFFFLPCILKTFGLNIFSCVQRDYFVFIICLHLLLSS